MWKTPPTACLSDHFSALSDPHERWRVLYPRPEILLLILSATLCRVEDFVEIRITETRYELHNFVTRSRRQTFSTGAAPLSVTRQAVFPHGSMNFRSLEAVNGLRPPEAARQKRANDSLKASEKRGFHEVDGAPCQAGAGSGRASLPSLRGKEAPCRRPLANAPILA
jgi:hypothetical protein